MKRLPGDSSAEREVARIIRVDHAGEYGAKRIYDGQLAVLGRRRNGTAKKIRHMAEQEQRHLEVFEKLVVDRRVRPTALSPVWHVAGFALGAATALLGERAAMACTVAVEEVIDEHYQRQIDALGEDEPALKKSLEEFRSQEIEHRDTAQRCGRPKRAAAALAAIKAGSRLAIWLSTRI